MKLFIFGATGDLVKRKVLPALQELNKKNLDIVALGRKEISSEEFNSEQCTSCSINFKQSVVYKKINFDKGMLEQLEDELDKQGKNYFYVSLPPKMVKDIIVDLKGIGKKYNISILIEKPFGFDLKSARELKEVANEIENVFLADHYLFKKEADQIIGQDFKKIKFVFLEKVGLEGRTYYDEIGAIKDMVQSHFFNLLFKIHPKIKHDLKMFSIEKYIRRQYNEYKNEIGRESQTETFIDLILKSQHKQFEFITGKAFEKKQSCIFLDNKRISFNENVNPYVKMLDDFFNGKKENFPKIDDAIFSWELITWIFKHKSALGYYPSGKNFVCENI
jgi:glucose-6-phosphate 1-dehydrogenase